MAAVTFPMMADLNKMQRSWGTGDFNPATVPANPSPHPAAPRTGAIPEGPSRLNSGLNAVAGLGYSAASVIPDAALALSRGIRDYAVNPVLRATTGTEIVPDNMKYLTPDALRVTRNDTLDALSGVVRPVSTTAATAKPGVLPSVKTPDLSAPKTPGVISPAETGGTATPPPNAFLPYINAIAKGKKVNINDVPQGAMMIEGESGPAVYVPEGSLPKGFVSPKGVNVHTYKPREAAAAPGAIPRPGAAPGAPAGTTGAGMPGVGPIGTVIPGMITPEAAGGYHGHSGLPYEQEYGHPYDPANPNHPRPAEFDPMWQGTPDNPRYIMPKEMNDLLNEIVTRTGPHTPAYAKQLADVFGAQSQFNADVYGKRLANQVGMGNVAVEASKAGTAAAIAPSEIQKNIAYAQGAIQKPTPDTAMLQEILKGYQAAVNNVYKSRSAGDIDDAERDKQIQHIQQTWKPLIDNYSGANAPAGAPAGVPAPTAGSSRKEWRDFLILQGQNPAKVDKFLDQKGIMR